jgi:hypothetical protein
VLRLAYVVVYSYGMTETGALTEAPAYIARDTYVGRHSIHRPVARVKAASFTAAELAAMNPTGIIWESFGTTFPGRESFGRRRYIADAGGNLHIYDSDGARKQIHPATRTIRVLTS